MRWGVRVRGVARRDKIKIDVGRWFGSIFSGMEDWESVPGGDACRLPSNFFQKKEEHILFQKLYFIYRMTTYNYAYQNNGQCET